MRLWTLVLRMILVGTYYPAPPGGGGVWKYHSVNKCGFGLGSATFKTRIFTVFSLAIIMPYLI